MHSVNQDLVLAVRDERPVSSHDWASFVAAANETRQRFGRIRLLVMTDGPGPTPAQRKMATDAGWMNNSSPMAIVTDSAKAFGYVARSGPKPPSRSTHEPGEPAPA